MSRTTPILPQHVAKTALVYVRQSTPKQVLHNQESLRHQYQLVETAVQLGWPQARTCIIDDDLGLSGTSSAVRHGLQRLVAAISLGEVGIVLVTEVSRLSRLDSDWHWVIELCAVFGRHRQVGAGMGWMAWCRLRPLSPESPSYRGYRYRVEIISHAVWLYFCFYLSLRDVEELLAERGVTVTYETIRAWCA